MKDVVRDDAVTFLGTIPSDPDSIPREPPCGFIWMIGGSLGGSHETYGLADVRICHDGETLDFVMTLADALSLRGLVDQAIKSMRACADEETT